MIEYLFLITALVVAGLTFGLVLWLARKHHFAWGDKLVAILLACVFVIRFYSYSYEEGTVAFIIRLGGFSLGSGWAFFSGISIYLEIAGVLLFCCYPFFRSISSLKHLLKWIFTPAFLLYVICYHANVINNVTGIDLSSFHGWWVEIFFALEAGLYAFGLAEVWRENPQFSWPKKEVGPSLLLLLGIILAAMPDWALQYFFGYAQTIMRAENYSVVHRCFIYTSLLFPFGLYFVLRNRSEDVKRFVLIYYILGVAVQFSFYYDYTMFLFPYYYNQNYAIDPKTAFDRTEFLPLHACNLALYIIPLCLIFKLKKVYYWTYFIMVFGAFMAILMPDLSDTLNILDRDCVKFYCNHIAVVGVPLLGVALGLFPKPKMKDMFNSFIWFGLYFIVITLHNAYYGSNFLFTNSTFIAEKAGSWAESLFQGSWVTTWGGRTVTFHPAYQALFFLTYVALAFAMWYVYALGYLISERHYALYLKNKKVDQAAYAFASSLKGRRISEPMKPDSGVTLEIQHFSKCYEAKGPWAVSDANLVIHGGEIFGFLGPNGAGKSTTIKSIVGIQSLSEGQIVVCGYDIARQSVEAKNQIGYVPDHYALYEKLTGREYINYIADLYGVNQVDRDERMARYVALFNLKDAFDSQIKTYSHGMKQKITIIAALIHEPKIWILDEPLTGLDPDSIFQVKECMRLHAEKGNAVIFSSHLIDVVENLCTRIVVIKKGHMSRPYTMEEIHKQGSLEQFYMEKTDDLYLKEKEDEEKKLLGAKKS